MMYELAQLNIALMPQEFESPVMKDFVDNLDRINALAEGSEGFVWRLQTDEGNATAIRPFGEEYLVNLSVWRDLESLRQFVFRSAHSEFLRRRGEWFAKMEEAYSVLWWVPAGSRPTVEDARDRLELLRSQGPSPGAFTFRESYPPA